MTSPEHPIAKPNEPQIYKVGTLRYTRGGLLTVIFWLLWGDLFLTFMEAVFPALIPLQLKWQSASDPVIGLLSNSIPFAIGVLVCPFIGMMSDRHRGRLGRRRPFLLWSTPCVVLMLSLLGFADKLGPALHAAINSFLPCSQEFTTIVLLGLFGAGFTFFNQYTMQVYGFLGADVIPQEVYGRMAGLYRAIGVLSSFAFNYWVYGLAETYLWQIYTGAALLYGIAFMIVIWRVKEGEYPPPDTRHEGLGLWGSLKLYIRDCCSHRFYILYFSIIMFFWFGTAPFWTFVTFYITSAGGREGNLGMTLEEFGKIKGWGNLFQIPIFIVLGALADYVKQPIRLVVWALAAGVVAFVAGFFFVDSPQSLLLWWMLHFGAVAMMLGAANKLPIMFLPRELFGQFSSAIQVFLSLGMIAGPTLCGWFLQVMGDYRYVFLWGAVFTALAMVASILTWREWLKLGGADSFVAPLPGNSFKNSTTDSSESLQKEGRSP